MAKFLKRVIAPGTYRTRDGQRVVTSERVKHWHDSARAILATGQKIPVAWGHDADAEPHSAKDKAYWSRRFIAGHVTDSVLDPTTNELAFELDIPGAALEKDGRILTAATLPDGKSVTNAHGEVSLGSKDWTDGQGREWPDAPIHLAITPLPVWVPEGGQPGFEAAEKPSYFGLADLLFEGATDGDKPPKKDDADEEDGRFRVPIKDILARLKKVGLKLPDDTSPKNFVERLNVALCVREDDMPADPTQDPKEEAGTYLATEMSTETKPQPPSPRELALAAIVEGEARRKRLERIDAMAKRGLLAASAKKLRERVSSCEFSLAEDGTVQPSPVDDVLDLLEPQLMAKSQFDRAFFSAAQEEEPPEERQQGAEHYASVADEVARNSGLPARNGKGA